MSRFDGYQAFKEKLEWWKAALTAHRDSNELSLGIQDNINDLIVGMDGAIRNMNIAINRMDTARDGGTHINEDDLLNYENNFDVVATFMHALINGNDLRLNYREVANYISAGSIGYNYIFDRIADYWHIYEDPYEAETEAKDKAIPMDPSDKINDNTYNSDGDDDGIYTAMIGEYNNLDLYQVNPLAKVEAELVIPGLESIFDFSFFWFITV
jgi:hypothetical protein